MPMNLDRAAVVRGSFMAFSPQVTNLSERYLLELAPSRESDSNESVVIAIAVAISSDDYPKIINTGCVCVG